MRERPILRGNRGPAAAAAAAPATGGHDLTWWILQIDTLRLLLGYGRWSDLAPHCKGEDPKTLDGLGLAQLLADLQREYDNRPQGNRPTFGLDPKIGTRVKPLKPR